VFPTVGDIWDPEDLEEWVRKAGRAKGREEMYNLEEMKRSTRTGIPGLIYSRRAATYKKGRKQENFARYCENF